MILRGSFATRSLRNGGARALCHAPPNPFSNFHVGIDLAVLSIWIYGLLQTGRSDSSNGLPGFHRDREIGI
ncbi:MAG: hypothetical protein QF752_01885 [Planctomycetota bacterium]|nr:hypothetical protein [Planctomycetota bacterium]